MASHFFKPSRLVAVAIVAVAVLWIGSGIIFPHHPEEPTEASETVTIPLQRVGVETLAPEEHQRLVVSSGVTQADQRAYAVARGGGVVSTLKVAKGDKVRKDDVVATISDEGRASAVAQAKAGLDQRQAELQANQRLIERGVVARNTLQSLEAAVAAAQAALAAAEAEAQKITVLAPVDGLINEVPVEVGLAVQQGQQVAEIIGPDPMLAVGSVTEKQRSHVRVGDQATVRLVDGTTATGSVNFVSLTADKATRTYRIEVKIPNPDAAIADGVSCEIVVSLEPVVAVKVPLSALVFSDAGELGLRTVDEQSRAQFQPVTLVDDERGAVWVSGLEKPTRVITVGQDFVRDGDPVEAVTASELDSEPAPTASAS
jgi:multidrug efflux system membrane fusion protein